MAAMSDIAFYIVDGIYLDEFDDAGEADREELYRKGIERKK